jgi:hypothetical protein
MRAIWAILLLCTSAVPALAQQQWQLRCAIDSDGNGYNIYATNNGPGPVTCTASCSVSTSDGLTQTVNCTTTIQAGYSDVPICGTGPGSPGRPPYSNAQLSADSTCNR